VMWLTGLSSISIRGMDSSGKIVGL